MNREVHVRFWESARLRCLAPLAYLHAFETGSELRQSLAKWIGFYNTRRPHSQFDGRTPDEVYFQIATTPSPGHAPETVSGRRRGGG
ncbi:MAG: transposase, partial [Telmatospirillum sp.]|nr:transposase [Telmatospirillum sp.]